MNTQPAISLIIPTRKRVQQLRRLLDSLAETANEPDAVEVVLVVDEDDPESIGFRYDRIAVRHVIGAAGLSMGAMNSAGYEASTGRIIMLLNDDVVARTTGWDRKVLECFAAFPDEIVLAHVNDLLFGENLCTFPIVSRTFCEFVGGICPREYVRYRIDDHIGDIFNLLGLLGERRIVYMPDVIFEHFHFFQPLVGQRQYAFDEAIMSGDAPRFLQLADERKRLAMRLLDLIESRRSRVANEVRRRNLDEVTEPFDLRVPGRLRVGAGVPNPARARVTVGVVTRGRDEAVRPAIESLRAHTPDAEIIIVETNGEQTHQGVEWNRLLRWTQSDFLVLTEGRVRVGPHWLPRLFEGLSANCLAVMPLEQDEGGRVSYTTLPAWSDPQATPAAARPMLTLHAGLFMLDAVRCRELLFDERYGRYFGDIDFGLRAWEAGWSVNASPRCMVTRSGSWLPSPGNDAVAHRFMQDRQRLLDDWFTEGRSRILDERLTDSLIEFRRLLDLVPKALSLLKRARFETLKTHQLRSDRLYRQLKHYPVFATMLADAAVQGLRDTELDIDHPDTGHLAWLLGLAGWPVVLDEDDRGWRTVRCGNFWAIPTEEGEFTLARQRRGGFSQVLEAQTLEELERLIDEQPRESQPSERSVAGAWGPVKTPWNGRYRA